jgi:glycoside hydrolase-like protein
VIRSRARKPNLPLTAAITILAALIGVAAAPGDAAAASGNARVAATKIVSYHGASVQVPADWPVFRLGADSGVCVRFNRHAVYLGTPGTNEDCPVRAIGRTEAILIAPEAHDATVATDTRSVLAPTSTPGAALGGGAMATLVEKAQHVVITATWGRDRAAIREALALRSLRGAMLATNGHRPPKASTSTQPRAIAHTTSPAAPALPGAVYNGLGFDTCTTQSPATMSAWGAASPYAAVGVYIGGVNAACTGGYLNSSWVSAESAAGWHLIPIYVGLQAPGACSCQAITASLATSQGTAAAQDAVIQAQALGIGTGNPIYLDMEGYKRSTATTTEVLAFIEAWTEQLHASGYLSGVYSSGASGITDLVSDYGTGYVEPDELWTADWDSTPPATPPTSAANPYVPDGEWQNNQQLLQYLGGRNEKYGNVTVNIDSDYIDAVTAAFGTGAPPAPVVAATPSLTIRPQADGSVHLTPRWAGAPGVRRFQVLAGASPATMTVIQTVSANRSGAIDIRSVYPYFGVAALNSSGQIVASSTPVATPASVAIFGNSAFVGSSGPAGVPVACLNVSPCKLQAVINEGSKRLAHSGTEAIARHGGVLLVPLSKQVRRLIATAADARLPVTVTVTSPTGLKAMRPLSLVPFTASGKVPRHRAWASSAVQILGKIDFVSSGWVGGILAACKATAPCVTTTTVTRSGIPIATSQPQTLGAGEVGYLTFRMTANGHALLRASRGNQLGARISVRSVSASSTGGATANVTSRTAMALVSLDSYR